MTSTVAPAAFPPNQVEPYQYWARVDRIVDGDTLDVIVELGFEITIKARVRLAGVDAPEIHGVPHSSDEYQAGLKAKRHVEHLAPHQSWVELRTYKSGNREKYGRWIAAVYADGTNIADDLITNGLAEPHT